MLLKLASNLLLTNISFLKKQQTFLIYTCVWSIEFLLSNTISRELFFFEPAMNSLHGIKMCSFSCCCWYRLGMTHGSLQVYWVHLIHGWPQRSSGVEKSKNITLTKYQIVPSEDFTPQCTSIYMYINCILIIQG